MLVTLEGSFRGLLFHGLFSFTIFKSCAFFPGGGVDGDVWGHNTFGASDGDRFFNGPRLHVLSKSRKSGALPPLPLTS